MKRVLKLSILCLNTFYSQGMNLRHSMRIEKIDSQIKKGWVINNHDDLRAAVANQKTIVIRGLMNRKRQIQLDDKHLDNNNETHKPE